MARHIGGDGLDAFEIGHTGFEHQTAMANATAAGCMCGGLPRHKPDADRRRTGGQRGEGVWHFCAATWRAGCRRTDSRIEPERHAKLQNNWQVKRQTSQNNQCLSDKETAVDRKSIPACAMQPSEKAVEVFKEQNLAR
jgi:hypothetical protein